MGYLALAAAAPAPEASLHFERAGQPDEVKRLRDLGVQRFVTGPPGFAPDDVTRGFEKLGNEILAKL